MCECVLAVVAEKKTKKKRSALCAAYQCVPSGVHGPERSALPVTRRTKCRTATSAVNRKEKKKHEPPHMRRRTIHQDERTCMTIESKLARSLAVPSFTPHVHMQHCQTQKKKKIQK